MFDKFIFKKQENFYIKLDGYEIDFKINIKDIIKFSYEGKKYIGKVISGVDNIYKLSIV
jgi:hypothetical protein